MGPETFVWGLLVLGVVLAVLLVLIVLARLRRLRRERLTMTSDVTRGIARLQLLAATRGNRPGGAMRTPERGV